MTLEDKLRKTGSQVAIFTASFSLIGAAIAYAESEEPQKRYYQYGYLTAPQTKISVPGDFNIRFQTNHAAYDDLDDAGAPSPSYTERFLERIRKEQAEEARQLPVCDEAYFRRMQR